MVHKFGDVRGNYTDSVVLKFMNDYEFYEILSECYKHSNIEIDGINYYVNVDIFSDAFEVWDDDGKYIGTVHGYDKEDIVEEIKKVVC